MGRNSTGVFTCEGSKRIELSHLLKKGYLRKNGLTSGELSWTNGQGNPAGNIGIMSYWGEDEIYIRLNYTITQRCDGSKQDYNYKIYLTSVPSNLGKGEVQYFICPQSGKRCRKLYLAYDSNIWKSREAYKNRIYYDCQTSSKMNRPNDRYWALERRLEKMQREKYLTYSYNGKPTRKALRMDRMREMRNYFDSIRWLPMFCPLSMRRELEQYRQCGINFP